jgi:hypothetical protein
VCKGHRPVGLEGGRPAFELVQTKTSWTRVYMRRERLWQSRKSVEADRPLGELHGELPPRTS